MNRVAWSHLQQVRETQAAQQIQPDIDGIAPGVDMELQGKTKLLTFTGKFFAMPDVPYMRFSRMVHIIFASKEVYVAQDTQYKNLYVVDREKNLSLGCRMTATLTDVPTGVMR